MMRTTLYADDVVVFMALIKRDIDNLSEILKSFGDVTGLYTNFHKSSIVLIVVLTSTWSISLAECRWAELHFR